MCVCVRVCKEFRKSSPLFKMFSHGMKHFSSPPLPFPFIGRGEGGERQKVELIFFLISIPMA